MLANGGNTCQSVVSSNGVGNNIKGVSNMKVIYNRNEIEENAAAREALISIMSDAKHGGFMRINGFQSKGGHGEIQDTTYCKGINYGEAVKRSLAMLEEIEADDAFKATVTRGPWNNVGGVENPTGRKSKVFCNPLTVTETYRKGDAGMTEALAKVRKALTAPARPAKEYEKLGNGVYKDDAGTIFVRDLRLVNKTVVVKGDYPFKASKAVTALTNAIKKDMPIGNYRMFRLDAEFDKVVLGGIEVAPESENVETKTEQEKDKTSTSTATVLA
jgi:hypothetical protein